MRVFGALAFAHFACVEPRTPVVASEAIDVLSLPPVVDAGELHEEDAEAPAPPEPRQDDVGSIVARVEAAYVPPFEIDFEEEHFLKSYNLKKRSSGHLAIASLGRVSVTYATKQRIVAANGTQTIEDPSGPSYYSRPVPSNFCPGAIAFASPGTLTSRLTFETHDGAQLNSPGSVVLVGMSRSPSLSRALYYVDRSSAEVKRVLFVDGTGNRTRYDFRNLVKSPRLAPALFRPTPGIVFVPIAPSTGGSIATALP